MRELNTTSKSTLANVHQYGSTLANWIARPKHVTSAGSSREVIDALNAEEHEIDIILAEVDPPMDKGMKMLKYIMRDTELQRIPVIMLSSQDDISFVVKCLRLGAADYLVKPLRANELSNLWTHMWRRRRMLGLPEKKILKYDCGMVASKTSVSTMDNTALFPNDVAKKLQSIISETTSMSNNQQDEVNVICG